MQTQKLNNNKSQKVAEKAIAEIEKIYQDFLIKIEKIKKERDQKIMGIFEKSEKRHLAEIRENLKGLRE